MHRIRRFGLGAAIIAAFGMSQAVPAFAADPTGDVTIVTIAPGKTEFLFTGQGIGDPLDPATVKVSVGDAQLPSVAVPADGNARRALPPRAVVIAFDVSGSMAGPGMTAAKAAAMTYLKELPAEVQVGLVTYSHVVTNQVTPTSDRARMQTAINRLEPAGDTALYDGVVAAADVLGQLAPNTIKRMLILSDGADTASQQTVAAAVNAVTRVGAAADVVAFGLPEGDQAALNRIAAGSKGTVLQAKQASDLAAAFSAAARAFNQQLLVTVKVPDELADKRHDVTITAKAGAKTVIGETTLTFAEPLAKAEAPIVREAPTAFAEPGGIVSLPVVMGIVFATFLLLALMAMWVPTAAGSVAQRRGRLAEIGRYRVHAARSASDAEFVAAAPVESAITQQALGYVDKLVRARGKRESIVEQLDRAGLRIRPEEWAAIQISAVLATGAVFYLLSSKLIGLVFGGVLGWLACRTYLRFRQSKRAAAFAAQLPDMLQLIAGSLRSGFSLPQAIAAVMREGSEPSASEIARALTEVRLGSEMEDALDRVADRMDCKDLHWVVMAIRISRQVGGNMAEVLQNTVGTIRERAQVHGQVKVLSAEGRYSAKILIGLPFMMVSYLSLVNPTYLKPLYTSGTGVVLSIIGCALTAVGAVWINRLVKIEV